LFFDRPVASFLALPTMGHINPKIHFNRNYQMTNSFFCLAYQSFTENNPFLEMSLITISYYLTSKG